MKNILVPFEYIETMPHILDCALSIASEFGSAINGLALQQRIDSFVAQEGSIIFDAYHEGNHKINIEEFGLKFHEHINTAKNRNHKFVDLDCRWLSEEFKNQKYLGDISRVFDLVIVSRPYQDMQSAGLSSIQTVLFDGGRPVLLIPTNKEVRIGEKVLISWNCTTESSRAIFSSLPILKKAKKVTVLTVEKVVTEGPSADDVVDLLLSHNIKADRVLLEREQKDIGSSIIEYSESIDADLIIKGAYTQSRLREIIFGGATRHLLLNSEIPIFLVN
ncbi:MAG: universal stress protein [Alphaproteobacteria bacterium]|jgi:nucleotide-binding universal stress UspA family protein